MNASERPAGRPTVPGERNEHQDTTDDLGIELTARAIAAAPAHRPVLDLLDPLDLHPEHRRVVDTLARVGGRAALTRWVGPGWRDVTGGPSGFDLLAGAIGWDIVRLYLLARWSTDADGRTVPIELVVERYRRTRANDRLRRALVAAECAACSDRDPARIAGELVAALADVVTA